MVTPIKLFGVLVTYRRADALSTTLDRLRAQTRPIDLLLVIDNAGSSETKRIVEDHIANGLGARYVDAGDNLGPAGGFALGMEIILEEADDTDWIFLFDDDDPPFFDMAISDAASFGIEMTLADPATAGVGISGGRFDARKGRVLRIGDEEIHGPVHVDHITGGGLPAYQVGPIRKVGVFLSELFFGFEELEYGLRLTRRGFRLYADGDRWKERKRVKRELGLLPPEEVSGQRAAQTTVRVTAPTWRRFYSLRNLIYVLRQTGAPVAAIKVGLTRGLLKPLVNLPLSPQAASRSFKMNWRAFRDGWSGRLGRTIDPDHSGEESGSSRSLPHDPPSQPPHQ